MPLTHLLATSIGARLTEVRKKGILDWVRPDGKTQVTVEVRREGGREGEVASREGEEEGKTWGRRRNLRRPGANRARG
jgi:hypothetical protein